MLIVIMLFLCGVIFIFECVIDLEDYKEGDTLEELESKGMWIDDYVSFYIYEYVNKEIYFDGDVEYEVYTVLTEHNGDGGKNFYMRVMVKDQDTKQKFENVSNSKVHIQGVVLDISDRGYEFGKEWENGVPEGVDIRRDEICICDNLVVMETELPNKWYEMYIGLTLVIGSIIVYRLLGGIAVCLPNVNIKADKFLDYNNKYYMDTHNMQNELLCEKENLKNLHKEYIENKKVSNIMCIMFILGAILFFGDASFFRGTIVWAIVILLRLVGGALMFIGIGGVWSKFINSSHKLAVYIAVKRRKRSVYVEIEKCKKNIQELERIIDEKNKEEIEGIFV